MSCSEQHCRAERERLERIIDNLSLAVLDLLKEKQRSIAVSAAMKLDNMTNATKATFTEFAADGSIVKPSGPITFASDNPAVATVDSAQQVLNPDNSVSVPVVTPVGPGQKGGVANITGVDKASTNQVAAGDVDNVTAPTGPVATSAKLVLS